jgi:hypothetical protein
VILGVKLGHLMKKLESYSFTIIIYAAFIVLLFISKIAWSSTNEKMISNVEQATLLLSLVYSFYSNDEKSVKTNTGYKLSSVNTANTSGNNSPAINAETVNIYNKKSHEEKNDNKEIEFSLFTELDISGFHKVKKIKKSDISKLLDSVFTFEEHGSENIAIVIDMVDPDNEDSIEPVVTCRRYNHLSLKGFYPKTNWDIKFSSRLNKSCKTLKFLLLAETASVSYMKTILWDRESLKLFPMELSSMGNMFGDPADKTLKTIYELDNRVKLAKKADYNENYNICFEIDKFYGICLQTMTKADINQDGIEDLIVYMESYATEGSHSYGTVIAFTRADNKSPYTVISAP